VPNPWGFYNVLGNVGEWTSDRYLVSAYKSDVEPGTGARQISEEDQIGGEQWKDRTIRGPGWFRDSSGVRVSARYRAHESVYKTPTFGMRPARMLDR
jgi:formylglycine-generating enzyme required for sulfatase activity